MPKGTVAIRVPQTLEEANQAAMRIQELDRKIYDAEGRRKDLSKRLKVVQAEKGGLESEREKEQARLRAWADPRRNQLVPDDRKKSFRFECGAVGQWGYPSSASLVVAGTLETVLKALLRLPNWQKYVEIKLKKTNIKSDLADLHKASRTLRRALHTSREERFWVKS